MNPVLPLLLAVAPISVVAQLCLKLGVDRSRGVLLSPRTAWRAVFQPLIWTGGLLYASGSVIWIRALALADLSFVYPFAAIAYAGGVIASQILLRERVTLMRWAGLALIICGVLLVASGRSASDDGDEASPSSHGHRKDLSAML